MLTFHASPAEEFRSAQKDTDNDVAAAILVLACQVKRVAENYERIADATERLAKVAEER